MADDTSRLEKAIKAIGLTPKDVLVSTDGTNVQGYSVIITEPGDLVELMRRVHDLSIQFSPHPDSDELFVVYVRP